MKQISLLLKPASSLCNLKCRYCFYEDVSANRACPSMGIMQEDTVHALIEKTLQLPVEQVNYCFQGGEPTVAGLPFFQHFVAYVKEKNVDKKITYAIQTNATMLDEGWYQLFADNHFLVGVSLDGFMENHNRFRKDARQKGTYTTIMHALKQLDKWGIDYNVLTVLTHELSKKPDQLFAFYMKHQIRYVQLIPCLPSLEGNQMTDRFRLTPEDFFQFYKRFFDLWYDAYRRGHYLSVTLFDNLIPMYRGIPPQQCGMLGRCHMQLVVEGNGQVYPCDFYVLDQYCCGNILTDDIEAICKHEAGRRFVQEARQFSPFCATCAFRQMCQGNCKRLAVCYYDDKQCGYQRFLAYSQARMQAIAQQLRD